MTLPDDITRCANHTCLMKGDCLRYIAETMGKYHLYSDFKPDKYWKCEFKIDKTK